MAEFAFLEYLLVPLLHSISRDGEGECYSYIGSIFLHINIAMNLSKMIDRSSSELLYVPGTCRTWHGALNSVSVVHGHSLRTVSSRVVSLIVNTFNASRAGEVVYLSLLVIYRTE